MTDVDGREETRLTGAYRAKLAGLLTQEGDEDMTEEVVKLLEGVTRLILDSKCGWVPLLSVALIHRRLVSQTSTLVTMG